MTDAERTAQAWLIAGRVQGVGYRAWMIGEARQFGVDGFVRNLPDGNVEAIVAGTRQALAKLLEACREGPAAARVEGVEVATETGPAPVVGSGFSQRSA